MQRGQKMCLGSLESSSVHTTELSRESREDILEPLRAAQNTHKEYCRESREDFLDALRAAQYTPTSDAGIAEKESWKA